MQEKIESAENIYTKKGCFSGGQQARPMPDAVGRDKKEGNPEESPQAQNKVSDFFGYCK